MRALEVIRIGLFALTIVWPLATLGRTGGALNEQRTRTPMPALFRAGGHFPDRFDAYVRDNFGSRDRLIRWHNMLKFLLLGQSPLPSVIIGHDGWLFYNSGIDIRNFAGRWPHTPADIEAWLRKQDAREREYAELGARYLIVVAPDKQTIHPSLVPRGYGPQAPGMLDELLQSLEAHPRLHVLDLRPALRLHADEHLYPKGDTHWNARGAFFAAQAITDALRPELPAVGVIRESDYVLQTVPLDTGDLVKMIGPEIKVPDWTFRLKRRTLLARAIHRGQGDTVFEQSGTRLPTAVLLGDSFGDALASVLCDAFSRLHYDFTTMNGPNPGLVAEERPDVVVLILVERNLWRLTNQ